MKIRLMENHSVKIPRDRLLFKELITALIAVILLSWLALLFSAPLAAPGGESTPSGTVVTAPWIFVSLQVLLGFLPPLWGGVLLPLTALSFLVLLPLEKGLHLPPRIFTIIFAALLVTGAALTVYGVFR
jgi:hypothetical protein